MYVQLTFVGLYRQQQNYGAYIHQKQACRDRQAAYRDGQFLLVFFGDRAFDVVIGCRCGDVLDEE